MRASFLVVTVCAALAAAGCGVSGPQQPVARLQGAVTINGQPYPKDAEGTITFMPAAGGGQAPPTSAPLIDGRYQAEQVSKGKVTVLFTITRLTGRMVVEDNAPGGTPFPERQNLVPVPCRQGIELEVKGDNSSQDFDLRG